MIKNIIVLFAVLTMFVGCVAMMEAKYHYEPIRIMNSSPRSIMVENVYDGKFGQSQSLAEQECQKYDGRHAIQKDRQQTYVKGYTVTYECVE